MATEAQRNARNKYNKNNTLNKTVSFNKKTESELINWISDKQFGTYIKDLIFKDMEAKKKLNE